MIRTHNFENSSMLASCSYNDEMETLIITFSNGKDYTYVDVPKSVYNGLIGAESAGKYFNSIKSSLTIKPKQ